MSCVLTVHGAVAWIFFAVSWGIFLGLRAHTCMHPDLDTLSPESFKFLTLENAKEICAMCTGVSFCGIPDHHIMCRCTPGPGAHAMSRMLA